MNSHTPHDSDRTPDAGVREFRLFRPKLRTGLNFSLASFRDRDCYTVEDPLRGRFHRIGVPEYKLLRLFDGERTIAAALEEHVRREGRDALTEHEALVVARWAVDSHLIDTADAGHADRLAGVADPRHGLAGKISNLFFLKLPLFNPDRFLTRLLPWMRWALGWPFLLLWLVVLATGISTVATHWDSFLRDSEGIFAPGNLLWLAIAWVGLKVVHETWHGLVCKNFGGHVPEFGVILILLVTPVGYVDATSSWRFPSKWQRIYVSLAGMYIELFIAAIAAIVWSRAEPGVVSVVAQNMIVMASVATVLFNANPLLRFDGYYALSDYFETPNLYAKGRLFVTWLAKRWLLGIRDARLPASFSENPWLIGPYGIAAAFWRVIVWVGILAGACLILQGAGVALVVLAVGAWLVTSTTRFVRYLVRGSMGEKPDPWYFLLRASVLVVALALILVFVSVPGQVRAPAVVEYSPSAVVRAECSGFVRQVLVRPGEQVEANQRLLLIENSEEQARARRLEIERDLAELRSRMRYGEENLPAYQVELENMRAAEQKLVECQRFVDSLDVRAPIAGTVIESNLESLPGFYLNTGDEILTVADDSQAVVRIAVSQERIGEFRARLDSGEPVACRIEGRWGERKAKLERVEPQASRRVPHRALSALWGGPLVVRSQAATESNDDQAGELVDPHFIAIARFSSDTGDQDLRDGELAQVTFPPIHRESLGGFLYRKVRDLFRSRSIGTASTR